MRVVICGAEGQLGRDLVEAFREVGAEVLGFDLDLDITDHALVMEKIPSLKPDLLVNAAADLDADGAELDPEPSPATRTWYWPASRRTVPWPS